MQFIEQVLQITYFSNEVIEDILLAISVIYNLDKVTSEAEQRARHCEVTMELNGGLVAARCHHLNWVFSDQQTGATLFAVKLCCHFIESMTSLREVLC